MVSRTQIETDRDRQTDRQTDTERERERERERKGKRRKNGDNMTLSAGRPLQQTPSTMSPT